MILVCQPQNIKLSPEPDGTSPVFENVASEEVFEETELPDANESSVVEERTIEDKKSPAVEKSNENIVSSDFDMDKGKLRIHLYYGMPQRKDFMVNVNRTELQKFIVSKTFWIENLLKYK